MDASLAGPRRRKRIGDVARRLILLLPTVVVLTIWLRSYVRADTLYLERPFFAQTTTLWASSVRGHLILGADGAFSPQHVWVQDPATLGLADMLDASYYGPSSEVWRVAGIRWITIPGRTRPGMLIGVLLLHDVHLLILALSVPALVLGTRYWRRVTALRRNVCVRCRYPLRGGATCPECGVAQTKAPNERCS